MLDDAKILTRHPAGKKGVNISREKYDTIRKFILDTVAEEGEISYQDLSDRAEQKLSSTFDGKVVWYVVTVKLDLEARGLIERVPKSRPHRIRIAE